MLFDYLLRHWQGKLSLPVSFWVNFVLPIVALLSVQLFWLDSQVARGLLSAPASVFTLSVVYFVLLVWQVVGINRSAKIRGASSLLDDVALINVSIVIVIAYLFIRQLDLLTSENTFGSSRALPGSGLQPLKDSPILTLHPTDQTSVLVSGTIGIAATRLLREFLTDNAQITTLILNSNGGNIFEARGMGAIVKELQLSTHVDEHCFSACTLIFVNGLQRTAALTAQFGFHAYRVDAQYPDVYFDVDEQQKKDAEVFLNNGVKPTFLDRIYQTEASDLWKPTRQDLIGAGFLRDYKVKP